MKEIQDSFPTYRRLVVIGLLILSGFALQSIEAPKASALLKDLVQSTLIEVPSIQVQTPVVQLETPKVQVESTGSLPSITVETPSLQVDTPVIDVVIPSAEAAIEESNGIIPEVEVTVPQVEVEVTTPLAPEPVIRLELRDQLEIQVELKPEVLEPLLPPVKVEVVTPPLTVTPPKTPVKVPEKPAVTDKPPAQSNGSANTTPVESPDKVKNELEAAVNEEASPDNELLSETEPLVDSGEPEEYATPAGLVDEAEMELPGEMGLPDAIQSNSDKPFESDRNQPTSSGSFSGNQVKELEVEPKPWTVPLTSKPHVPAGPIVFLGSGGGGYAGSGSGSSGAAGGTNNSAPWAAPFAQLEAYGMNRQDAEPELLPDEYLLGSDQWSKPPPEQPPMHSLLISVESHIQ